MKRSSIRTGALVVLVVGAAGVAHAAGGSLSGSVIERARADGSRSMGVTISEEQLAELPIRGRDFTSLALLVPKRRMRGIQPAHLPEGWTFDGASLSATGPAIRSGDFRFDFPSTWKPPKEIEVECLNGTQSVFREQLEVAHRPDVRVSNDHTEWADLPLTLRVGSELRFEPLARDKFRLGLTWRFEHPESALNFNWRLVDNWRVADVPNPFDANLVDLSGGIQPWEQPFTVSAFDRWGELWVNDTWQPSFLPPLHTTTGSWVTGASEILAPNSQVCLCGHVSDLDTWNSFRLGAHDLGAPIFSSSASALYALPQGLSPGAQPIEFLGEQPLTVADGLASTAVDVGGEVRQDIIRRGGSTPLILRIVGSQRSFPVVLQNKTPQYIELWDSQDRPVLREETMSSGGSPNQVQRTVKGIQATPPGERFRVAYRVGLPPCPCDEQNQQVSAQVGDEFAELLRAFDDEFPRVQGTDAQRAEADSGSSDLEERVAELEATTARKTNQRILSNLGVNVPRFDDLLLTTIDGEEIVGYFLGVPVTRSMVGEFARALDASPDCTPGSNGAVVGDGRWEVELDREIAPEAGGSCGDGESASIHSFGDLGVSVTVKPVVLDDTDVFLILDDSPQESEYSLLITEIESGESATFSSEFLEPIETRVTVQDGGTVLIGGLKNTESVEDEARVPWLGDLPILGALFRNESRQEPPRLLFFVTARLVRE
jgi:hypothetical protein